MALKAPEVEASLIDAVCRQLRDRLGEPATGWETFVRQYYHWVAPEDFNERSVEELAGAAVSQWELGQQRAQGEVRVRVFNPDLERDGWQLPHTVIQVVSDDMPFIVDSVTMRLARPGHPINLVVHPVIRVPRDGVGRLVDVLEPGQDADDAVAESVLHAEVSREPDPERLDELCAGVTQVLREVSAVVEDWPAMRD